jgi:hypothetical protein
MAAARAFARCRGNVQELRNTRLNATAERPQRYRIATILTNSGLVRR